MKYLIHIDKAVLAENAKSGASEPAICVCDEDNKLVTRVHRLELAPRVTLIQGDEPLNDGTRVWIEALTDSPISVR
jgi:hypothetical protein